MQTSDVNNLFRAESDVAKNLARQRKAELIENFGSPITVSGKILALKIRDNDGWLAESGHIIRRISLESGKSLQIYKGHTGPVTCLAFYNPDFLITGSWDKTIRVWNITNKLQVSVTAAHGDFVKTLLVIPALSLLVSGSSDKITRFWDLSGDLETPLTLVGSLGAHNRPVEAMAFSEETGNSVILYTTDSMGSIKVWQLQRTYGSSSECRATLKTEISGHRTGITDIWVGTGLVWTASKDESVLIQTPPHVSNSAKSSYTITHPTAVEAILPISLTSVSLPYLITASGDALRIYAFDPVNPDSPELVQEIDGHWDDITAIDLWFKVVKKDKLQLREAWILSASLDSTLRRWRLSDILVHQGRINPETPLPDDSDSKQTVTSELTEEEEQELAELMDEA